MLRVSSYQVFPENLEREAENSMKIVRIFLEDFKKQNGSFPKDLNVLREHGWKQYRYKLMIVNPWGQPFKYLVKGKDKYILEAGRKYPEVLDPEYPDWKGIP